jgi:hypothetical protein
VLERSDLNGLLFSERFSDLVCQCLHNRFPLLRFDWQQIRSNKRSRKIGYAYDFNSWRSGNGAAV